LTDQESTYVWYQQGDVTIKPVPKVPRRAADIGTRILAEGETTGNQHVAQSEDVVLFRHEDNLFMSAPTGTIVAHPKHQPLQIPPGYYVIGRVRVHDHFAAADDDELA